MHNLFSKRNVPFTSLKQINDGLDRLEKMGVLSKVDYSNWASPTVYVKKILKRYMSARISPRS